MRSNVDKEGVMGFRVGFYESRVLGFIGFCRPAAAMGLDVMAGKM